MESSGKRESSKSATSEVYSCNVHSSVFLTAFQPASHIPQHTMTTPEDRFKEMNCLVKELSFGHAAFVYLFITKQVADNILQWFRTGIIDEREAFLRLREALRTVKLMDPQNGVDFGDEFAALYHANRIHHPNLAEMLPGQIDHARKEWFEIEGLSAGTLKAYTDAVSNGQTFDHAPPVSFGWHIVYQLCEALLAFQFGAAGGIAPILNWPMLYHGDVTAANMLFRKPSRKTTATSFPGYPDIVLCDLGEAKELNQHPDHVAFFRLQYEDVRTMLLAIQDLFSIRPEVHSGFLRHQIQSYIDRLTQAEMESRYAHRNSALRTFLADLSAFAKSGRRATYAPPGAQGSMEAKAVAYFDRPIISDARLGRFWAKLRDGEIDNSFECKDDDSYDGGMAR